MADREASGIFLAPCRYNEFKKQFDEMDQGLSKYQAGLTGTNGPLPRRPGARSRSDPEQRSGPAAQKRRNPKITPKITLLVLHSFRSLSCSRTFDDWNYPTILSDRLL